MTELWPLIISCSGMITGTCLTQLGNRELGTQPDLPAVDIYIYRSTFDANLNIVGHEFFSFQRELILLDLIGTRDTHFVNHFQATSSLFEHLMKVGKETRQNLFKTCFYYVPVSNRGAAMFSVPMFDFSSSEVYLHSAASPS